MTKAALFIPQDVSAHQQVAWKNLIATVRSLSAASTQTAAAAPAATTNTQALQSEISALQASLALLQNQINGLTVTYTCAQAITKGQVVYESSNGYISVADYATLPTAQPVLGIAASAGSIGNKIQVVGQGETATGFTGLTPGILYLGANGTLVSTTPTSPDFATRVGYAVDSSSVLVNVEPANAAITSGAINATALQASTVALTGLPTIDGVTLTDGQIALLTGQSTGANNGPWVVHSGAWTRPTTYPTGGHANGIIVNVAFGTLYGNTTWVCTTQPPNDVIDTNITLFRETSYPIVEQNANFFYAGPTTGAAAIPAFRAMVDVDVPVGARTILARVISTTNIATMSGTLAIDGVSLSIGDVVLLSGQTTASQNGLWVIQSGAWTRPTSFATGSHAADIQVRVQQGTVNSATYWSCSSQAPNDVVDTSSLTFKAESSSGVTSVSSGNASPLFNVTVSNPTTTPAFNFAIISQGANLFYAGPSSGGATTPTFRAIAGNDLVAPPPIGTTTPNQGSFSQLAANSVPSTDGWLRIGSQSGTTAQMRWFAASTLATPIANTTEWDGTRFYITNNAATRNTVAYLSDITSTSAVVAAGAGSSTSSSTLVSLYSATLPANKIGSTRPVLRVVIGFALTGTNGGTVQLQIGSSTAIPVVIASGTGVTGGVLIVDYMWTGSGTAVAAYSVTTNNNVGAGAATSNISGLAWTSSQTVTVSGSAGASSTTAATVNIIEAP